jgi:hypothetical protein
MSVYRRTDGCLASHVFREAHTHRQLSATRHRQPAGMQALPYTLTHRATVISDSNSLPKELSFLLQTYRDNGYSERQILLAVNPRPTAPPEGKEDPASLAFLRLLVPLRSAISSGLSIRNVQTVGPRQRSPAFFGPLRKIWL